MTRLERALAALARDLRELNVAWALVGGLAVSARGEPRTTKDVDVAVAVTNDAEAEGVVARLRGRGYRILEQFEQEAVGRLATVEIAPPEADPAPVRIDLLFATSGIEQEIVAAAEQLRILPTVTGPVARRSHLVALKTLSQSPARGKDTADLRALLRQASTDEADEARGLLDLISARGYARGKSLRAELDEAIEQSRRSDLPEEFRRRS